MNAQLNAENSIFPKPTRGSTGTKKSGPGPEKIEMNENFSSTMAAAAVPLISPVELPTEQKDMLSQ